MIQLTAKWNKTYVFLCWKKNNILQLSTLSINGEYDKYSTLEFNKNISLIMQLINKDWLLHFILAYRQMIHLCRYLVLLTNIWKIAHMKVCWISCQLCRNFISLFQWILKSQPKKVSFKTELCWTITPCLHTIEVQYWEHCSKWQTEKLTLTN